MAHLTETIERSGRRIGGHAWIEMRLFEVLGRWSGTVVDPRARALFARQSFHHAWRAELWNDLLPALPHLPASGLVVPDQWSAELVATLGELDERSDPATDDGVADRLNAVYGVALPQLIEGYTDHLEHTTVVADGPTTRVLRLTLADLADDLTAGEALRADRATPAGDR
jgi:hypothetical protein